MIRRPTALTAEHEVGQFDCGVHALNDWLLRRALANEGRFSRTFVLAEADRVIAYVALAGGSIARDGLPSALRRNSPDPVPVAILARLAVDLEHGGRGLGTDLLLEAFRRVAWGAEHLGFAAMLVHAKDERALQFYTARAEFERYPSEGLTLFLPIETVYNAIGSAKV